MWFIQSPERLAWGMLFLLMGMVRRAIFYAGMLKKGKKRKTLSPKKERRGKEREWKNAALAKKKTCLKRVCAWGTFNKYNFTTRKWHFFYFLILNNASIHVLGEMWNWPLAELRRLLPWMPNVEELVAVEAAELPTWRGVKRENVSLLLGIRKSSSNENWGFIGNASFIIRETVFSPPSLRIHTRRDYIMTFHSPLIRGRGRRS